MNLNNVQNVQILRNVVKSSRADAIDLDLVAMNVEIRDNIVTGAEDDVSHATIVLSVSSTSTEALTTFCRILSFDSQCFELGSGSFEDVVVTYNDFVECGQAADIDDDNDILLEGNLFLNNPVGIIVDPSNNNNTTPFALVRKNCFVGNEVAVDNTADGTLDARYNWWGSFLGPKAEEFGGMVDTFPFLKKRPVQPSKNTDADGDGLLFQKVVACGAPKTVNSEAPEIVPAPPPCVR